MTLLLARGFSVEKIAQRFGKHPSTVSYWMGKYGLDAPNRDKHAAKGGIARERLVELVAAGLSIAQIAGAVGLSKATVRHWLRRYGLRTQNANRRERRPAAKAAREAGLLAITMSCPTHGQTEFSIEGRGYYRCRRCRSEAVTNRRGVKATLVAEAGGRCAICGYDRYAGALAFHHLDPLEKRLHVSAGGNGYRIETIRAGARKCVLLCANCHAEVESGVSVVPVKSGSGSTALHPNPG
ncbi:MAG: helix-turn-helix domain-containing protein [Solirubrobacteraceae bacterium]